MGCNVARRTPAHIGHGTREAKTRQTPSVEDGTRLAQRGKTAQTQVYSFVLVDISIALYHVYLHYSMPLYDMVPYYLDDIVISYMTLACLSIGPGLHRKQRIYPRYRHGPLSQ